MAKFSQEVEDRMLGAIKAVKEGEDGLSINKIAQKYNVKSQSLRRRLAGHGSVKNNGGRNRALSNDQMKTLFAFLDRQRSLNIPLGKEMVLAAAQRILDSDGSKHELGRRWYDRMIKDYPQYKVVVKMGPKRVVASVLDHLENLIKTQLHGDQSVVDVLTHFGSPLVSVGVLEAGEITSKVLGDPRPGNAEFRIMGAAKPYNNATLFQACSISKAITSLAVFKLAQEGTLNLDQPIFTYLNAEQLSLISTSQTAAFVYQITLKMLLSHTSGLSVGGFGGYNSTTIPTISQILSGEPPAKNPQVSLLRMPGQAFSYSGGGYVVIQLILETVLQKPFHQIMDEIVLKPLKMTRSTFSILPAIEKNFAPVYLTGKNPSDPVHHLFPESAAAGLWTTPSDLLRAITTIQFSLDSDEFLETEWAEIMLQEVGSNGMAHGWYAKKDGFSFGHAGSNDPGFRCHVMGYADLDKTEDDDEDEDMDDRKNVPNDCGIAIMTSSELGGIVREKVLAAIPYLKGWPAVSHSLGLSEVAIPFVDRSKQIDDRAAEWCGVWTSGPWRILVDNGFKLQYSNSPSVPLVPAAIPPNLYDEGSSIDLVADGFDIMIRLGWTSSGESRRKIVELWQNGCITTLELEPLEPSAP